MMAHEICAADILSHVVNLPEPYTEGVQHTVIKFKEQR